MTTISAIAYASVAYWLFWTQLSDNQNISRTMFVIRSALYLVGGPIGLAMIWIAAGLAIAAEALTHRNISNSN
jgi:predicted nucleic acid-binding protein